MREQMQARLGALKREFEAGQAELQQVERRQAYLREALLRISGAMHVLEELLADSPSAGEGSVNLEATESAVAPTTAADPGSPDSLAAW